MGIADLSAHQRMLAQTADGVMRRVTVAAGAVDISVKILAGVQAGAARRVKVQQLTLGSGDANDIVLLDDAVDTSHVTVEFKKSAFGVLAYVSALNAPVVANGQEVTGRADALTLPLELRLGDSTVRFERVTGPGMPGAAKGLMQRLTQGFGTGQGRDPILSGGMIGLGLLVGLGLAWQLFTWQPRYVVDVNQPSDLSRVVSAQARNWQADVQAQVAAFGLSETLRVGAVQDGLIRTLGQVPPTKLDDFRALQAWYDAQPGAPTMVWDVQRRTQLAQLPNIAMVRVSPPQAVILNSGTSVLSGDVLIDGWVLAEVAETHLTVTRGSESHRIDFKAQAK